MMVVHEDSDSPMEVAVIRKPPLEEKSYVIVKNHVKELSNIAQINTNTNNNEEKALESTKKQDTMMKKLKSHKKQKKNVEELTTPNENGNTNRIPVEIDTSDLKELKTVYMRCKNVIQRIETKYGHLLNLDSDVEHRANHLKRKFSSETIQDECNCKSKKKIVFDEDGRPSTIDVSKKHICVQKINTSCPDCVPSKNISIEYQDAELGLPENLQELGTMLHNPNIENTYRNKVLEKIRTLKEEYSNEIRFNKPILIEQLKSNPDEILGFIGTNLSTIPGYS